MRGPLRIVALLQQTATEYRHQLREFRMHAGAVQALVIVFPEYLPVALNGFLQNMAYDQFRERPGIEAIQGQIEDLLERRRPLEQEPGRETLTILSEIGGQLQNVSVVDEQRHSDHGRKV